jgi:hypothetical protein
MGAKYAHKNKLWNIHKNNSSEIVSVVICKNINESYKHKAKH